MLLNGVENRAEPATEQRQSALVRFAVAYSRRGALEAAYGDYAPGSVLRAARNEAWMRGSWWCNDHAREFPAHGTCPECMSAAPDFEGGGRDDPR